ncbi:MAG TPA: TetR/AcrR family transcriptional regulator [Anaerolineales bacterium]
MQHRSEETRGKIMEAAVRLFSNRGYKTASVDDICKEAGVSKGAFYHHFETKQALFLALLDGWLKTIDNAIEAAKDQPAPATFLAMAEAFPYIFESAGDNLPMFLEFWLQASRDEEIWEASIAPYRRYHQAFTELIQRGQEEGSFVNIDPALTSRMIVSMAMGLLLQSLLDPEGAKWEQSAREITNLMLDNLLKKERAL